MIAQELLRSMIDHTKVLILALNGPAVGGGAAWFPGIADIVLASNTAWLQCPFSGYVGLSPFKVLCCRGVYEKWWLDHL